MKKLMPLIGIIVLAALGLTSCAKKEEDVTQKWEYKIIQSDGTSFSDFYSKIILLPEEELNSLGEEGWELVDVYTRIETVHPNFGNEKYVVGIQPNTRTSSVYYVLKRPKTESGTVTAEPAATEEVAVEETVEEGAPIPEGGAL